MKEHRKTLQYMDRPAQCKVCKGKRILTANYKDVPGLAIDINQYKGNANVYMCVHCGEVLGLVDSRPDPASLIVAMERAEHGDKYDFKNI